MNHNPLRFSNLQILIASLGLLLVSACNHRRTYAEPTGDTIPASAFMPLPADTIPDINLKDITGFDFPKFKIKSQNAIAFDSLSIAADEEEPSSGNYAATLLFDSIPSPNFYAKINQRAAIDTCWKIKNDFYVYQKKDKQGGKYKLSFFKGSQQMEIQHLNADLMK